MKVCNGFVWVKRFVGPINYIFISNQNISLFVYGINICYLLLFVMLKNSQNILIKGINGKVIHHSLPL